MIALIEKYFIVLAVPEEKRFLSRLHITHSYMVHSVLLKEEVEPPVCIPCDELLAVEHVFVCVFFFFFFLI